MLFFDYIDKAKALRHRCVIVVVVVYTYINEQIDEKGIQFGVQCKEFIAVVFLSRYEY